MMDWRSKLQEARDAVRTGRFADSCLSIDDFLYAIKSSSPDQGVQDLDFIEAKSRCAQLHLLMLKKEAAADVLEPFVRKSDGVAVIDQKALGKVRSRLHSGLVRMQMANVHYAAFQYDRGLECILQARADFEVARHTSEGSEVPELAAWECDIWCGRLLHRSGQTQRAEERLREVRRKLYEGLRVSSDSRGGIKLLIALALDIEASFDWACGNLERGMRRVYHALAVLREGRGEKGFRVEDGPDCPVREGHALYLAARLESATTMSHYSWAFELLQQAKGIVKEEHPYFGRALVAEARIQLKDNRFDDAESSLDRIEQYQAGDADEERLRSAELLILRLRLEEGRARLRLAEGRVGSDQARWKACLPVAQKLNQMDLIPPQLRLEAQLHAAYVDAMIEENRREGQVNLGVVRRRAKTLGNRKIEVASWFAECESHLSAGHRERARGCYARGAQDLRGVRSDSLEQWRDSLSVRLEEGMATEINVEDGYSRAVKEFKRKLKTRIKLQADLLGRPAWEIARMSRSNWYRINPRSSQKNKPADGQDDAEMNARD